MIEFGGFDKFIPKNTLTYPEFAGAIATIAGPFQGGGQQCFLKGVTLNFFEQKNE